MTRKNRTPEENARREKIRELLQMANIGSMDDIQSLVKEAISEFMENGLEAELDCCRRASLSENRRRCVSEAAEVIWRKQNRVKEWP